MRIVGKRASVFGCGEGCGSTLSVVLVPVSCGIYGDVNGTALTHILRAQSSVFLPIFFELPGVTVGAKCFRHADLLSLLIAFELPHITVGAKRFRQVEVLFF